MKKVLIVLVALLALAACNLWEPSEPWEFVPPDNTPTDYSRDVVYEVSGSAARIGCITIENQEGGTSQYTDVIPPWTMDLSMYRGAFVYVSAQNGTSTGTVTAIIYVDDTVFKTSTSSGAYVIASAYGTLP